MGDARAAYMHSLLIALNKKNWRIVVYTRRGCGANSLATPLPQNLGDEEDLELILRRIELLAHFSL
jgi:predicted alpha/beta-fold hydrolase